MPSYRQLPSGKWQATVYKPDGKRVTKSNRLKSVVKAWALDLEARYARGEVRDPRAGEITIREWYAKCLELGGGELPTLDKQGSLWRTHCEPVWGDWPVKAVTRDQAVAWAKSLRSKRRGNASKKSDAPASLLKPRTIHDIAFVMTAIYKMAMEARPPLVEHSPDRKSVV